MDRVIAFKGARLTRADTLKNAAEQQTLSRQFSGCRPIEGKIAGLQATRKHDNQFTREVELNAKMKEHQVRLERLARQI